MKKILMLVGLIVLFSGCAKDADTKCEPKEAYIGEVLYYNMWYKFKSKDIKESHKGEVKISPITYEGLYSSENIYDLWFPEKSIVFYDAPFKKIKKEVEEKKEIEEKQEGLN